MYKGEILKNKMEDMGKLSSMLEKYMGEFLDRKNDGMGKYKANKNQYEAILGWEDRK